MLNLQLPSHFHLRDLTAITAPVFELKYNPFQEFAAKSSEAWFRSFDVYQGKKLSRFLSHRFDKFAGLSFPDADEEHLTTCVSFFFWAFSFDDLSDEGELQSKPEAHKLGVDISLRVFWESLHNPPKLSYAAMLQDIWKRLNAAATAGACARFARAAEHWANSQVEQSINRETRRIPSVAEFILLRRHTIGGAMVEAMVEYALEIDLPDFVFQDPIIHAMSDATTDIMTWPNDIISFNKEQADGDDQNLLVCLMVERTIGLQEAIDTVTDMIGDRVAEYVDLKSRLPSYGQHIDTELHRYLKGVEHFVQGTIVWYYSPRYFRDLDISDRSELVVPIFEPTYYPEF